MSISEVILDVLNGFDNKQCKRGDLIEKVKNKLANPDIADGDVDYVINKLHGAGKLRIGQARINKAGLQLDHYDDIVSIPPEKAVSLPPNVKH